MKIKNDFCIYLGLLVPCPCGLVDGAAVPHVVVRTQADHVLAVRLCNNNAKVTSSSRNPDLKISSMHCFEFGLDPDPIKSMAPYPITHKKKN
jgi:hypothetical protein